MNAGQAKVYISFWNGEGSVIISLSSCGDVFLLFRNTFRLLSMEKHNAKRTAAAESTVKYTVVYFSVPIIFKAVFPASKCVVKKVYSNREYYSSGAYAYNCKYHTAYRCKNGC